LPKVAEPWPGEETWGWLSWVVIFPLCTLVPVGGRPRLATANCAGGNCCVEGHGDPHIISDSITGSSLLWFSGWGQLLKPGSAARGPQECP
jgi:hypothetical protein